MKDNEYECLWRLTEFCPFQRDAEFVFLGRQLVEV